MRRLLALAIVTMVAAGACTTKGDNSPDPTVPTAVSTTTSTTAAEVGIDTIPEVIDAPYLNRVLAALEKVETSGVRVILNSKGFPPEAAVIFNSIYSDARFPVVADSWIDQLNRDPELKGLRRPVGERLTTVERLITVSKSCVWMAVLRDYSATDVNPSQPSHEYLGLRPLDPQNDPKQLNPTAWMIIKDGFLEDGSEPPNPCPSS